MKQKMNKKIKAKWLKALRSGEYEQGVSALKYEDFDFATTRYCCLGVLRAVLHPRSTASKDGVGTELHPKHLTECGLSVNAHNELIELNDEDRKSFKEIANYISKNL